MTEILFNKERYERSIANYGNPYRILKVFEKAKRGEEIVFAVIGGSITTMCNASKWENQYGYIIKEWLEQTFNTTVKFVNAGIGATGSLHGVHRLERDLFCHNPDFVAVEFAVNDGGDCDNTVEIYDNLINRVLNYETKIAVLGIGMMNDAGGNCQASHLKVAKHYEMPYISYRDAAWPDVEKGILAWSTLSNDGVHPIDAGHKLTADLVTAYLEEIMVKDVNTLCDSPCEKPLINNRLKDGKIFHAGQIEPKSYGCFTVQDIRVNEVKTGFVAEENGDPLVFEFENCKSVYLEYERSHTGVGGKGVAKVNGETFEMDSDFTGGWGTYHTAISVFKSQTPEKVTVEITPVLEEGKHFNLVGILLA